MPRKSAERGRVPFTLRLDEHILDQLEGAKAITGKESVADVVREAVLVYLELMDANQRDVRFSYEDRKSGEKGHIWLLPGRSPFRK